MKLLEVVLLKIQIRKKYQMALIRNEVKRERYCYNDSNISQAATRR